jgi:hypothetical protein
MSFLTRARNFLTGRQGNGSANLPTVQRSGPVYLPMSGGWLSGEAAKAGKRTLL